MKTLNYFVILLLGILVITCKNNNNDNAPSVSKFPNTIGTKYTYVVIDSINNKSFNLIVSVSGNTIIKGKAVSIWTFNYPNYIDTNYVYSTKDSVIFYDKTKTSISNVYHFPIIVGEIWLNKFSSDTSKVINNLPLTVKAGTFGNTFLIRDKAISPNYNYNRNQWYVPEVGLVKLNFREYNLGHISSQSWELIQYQIIK